jgi:hypothetical protein
MKPSPTRVATVYALKTSAKTYRDQDFNPIDQHWVDAIASNDAEGFAKILDSECKEEKGCSPALELEDLAWGSIPEIWKGEGVKGNPRDFKGKVERFLWKMQEKREKALISKSPWKTELKAIGKAMSYSATPDEVRYIKYQPRKRKGIYTSAILEDMGGRMGHGKWVINEDDAKRAGTTLQKVFEALNAMKAKLVSRGLGPGGKKPWIDYDGWAY